MNHLAFFLEYKKLRPQFKEMTIKKTYSTNPQITISIQIL